ncbi:hypothetical protein WN51_02564 [Melipona quadrifasciata]|uniref:Uncharacterized protein n=1 Tax=Melipona quadrifasciata TaxID=166423 RepID=A0A0N0U443_9HYME|nr:hypothetical protein WN51_02564 [Melipona quadrifasciata]
MLHSIKKRRYLWVPLIFSIHQFDITHKVNSKLPTERANYRDKVLALTLESILRDQRYREKERKKRERDDVTNQQGSKLSAITFSDGRGSGQGMQEDGEEWGGEQEKQEIPKRAKSGARFDDFGKKRWARSTLHCALCIVRKKQIDDSKGTEKTYCMRFKVLRGKKMFNQRGSSFSELGVTSPRLRLCREQLRKGRIEAIKRNRSTGFPESQPVLCAYRYLNVDKTTGRLRYRGRIILLGEQVRVIHLIAAVFISSDLSKALKNDNNFVNIASLACPNVGSEERSTILSLFKLHRTYNLGIVASHPIICTVELLLDHQKSSITSLKKLTCDVIPKMGKELHFLILSSLKSSQSALAAITVAVVKYSRVGNERDGETISNAILLETEDGETSRSSTAFARKIMKYFTVEGRKPLVMPSQVLDLIDNLIKSLDFGITLYFGNLTNSVGFYDLSEN